MVFVCLPVYCLLLKKELTSTNLGEEVIGASGVAWLIICFNIFVPAGIILAHVMCRSQQQDQDGDVNDAERAQLNHIFCVLDVDGSGALSVDEVATFVHVTSTPHGGDGTTAQAKALEMLRSADLDADGTLSEAEWNTFIASAYATRFERDAL